MNKVFFAFFCFPKLHHFATLLAERVQLISELESLVETNRREDGGHGMLDCTLEVEV